VDSQQFLHYRLAQRLGEGPLGETWQALDPALERGVAVKLLRAYPPAAEDVRSHYVIQCEQLHSAKHPPAGVFDWVVDGDHQAIIRELISGRSLAEVRSENPMAFQVALSLLARIALTVKDLHHAGMVHGNLHPWNVILDKRGNPWLTDMLVPIALQAWLAAVPATRKMFIAPEVQNGRSPDNRADIYSLGSLLAFLVADEKDITAATTDNSAYFAPPGSRFPHEGRLLLKKMLAGDPDERFADIDELIVTLDAIQHDMPARAPGRRKRYSPRTYLLLSIMAILLIIYWVVEWWVKK
jgi:serine/threonine protein kinase